MAKYRIKKFGGYWRVLERDRNLVKIHYPRFKTWAYAWNAVELALVLREHETENTVARKKAKSVLVLGEDAIPAVADSTGVA